MRVTTPSGIQKRIMKVACEMDCGNIKASQQGKSSKLVDLEVRHLMLIHEFVPYWNTEQLREVECYLNEKFKI